MIVEIFIGGGSLSGLDIVCGLAAPGTRESEGPEQSVAWNKCSSVHPVSDFV